jgi:hypothetical protein
VEHVVFFPAPDGSPAFRRLATIDDAARFVEHLRNVENVSEASVHTLTEIPVSFKAWYRVELPQTDTAPVEDSSESPTDAAPTTIAEVIESYAQADGTENGHPVELPEETGSTTGIVVPDRDFAASGQFAFASPTAEASGASDSEAPQAQVLEPVFGARRDRGTGYFVR